MKSWHACLTTSVALCFLLPDPAVGERPPGGTSIPLSLEGECDLLPCDDDPPGFELAVETDPNEMARRLLEGSEPSWIEIELVTLTPSDSDATGYYENFNLDDGTSQLVLPDGIILSTGNLDDGVTYCNDDRDTSSVIEESESGDTDIQNLYKVFPTHPFQPGVFDGVSIEIRFTSTQPGRLRFAVVLASEEFPEYTAEAPTPAMKDLQEQVLCYPDTFAGFLNSVPFTFAKDSLDRDVLLSVAAEVFTYNNNTAFDQCWQLSRRCGEMRDSHEWHCRAEKGHYAQNVTARAGRIAGVEPRVRVHFGPGRDRLVFLAFPGR